MKELDLRSSLQKTYDNLLISKRELAEQIVEAQNMIILDLQNVDQSQKIRNSITDKVEWYKYLLGSLEQINHDITNIEIALNINHKSKKMDSEHIKE